MMSTGEARRRCIGVLREVKNQWERRAPLTPDHVQQLVKSGIQVLVQPSERRIFKDHEYQQAGALLTDDISPATTIFGVKEFPAENLIPNRSYVIFSHVIKAQPENMPFLDACLEKNVRLFDYEGIVDDRDKRLVAFGRFAGNAGMIDCFRGVGQRLLSLGYSTPFMGISSSYMYPSLQVAQAAVTAMGAEITRSGIPSALNPLSFVFTGSGNVSLGAREIFQLLPHEMLSVSELELLKNGKEQADKHKLYGCVARIEDLVAPSQEAQKFDKAQYYENPELYKAVFSERLAPLANVIVNGIYWEHRFPRLLRREDMVNLKSLFCVADISCDIGGSIEFLERASTIDQPFYLYDPDSNQCHDNIDGPGTLVLAVDNLPAEFPREASSHFSSNLVSFVPSLSDSDAELPRPIARACITENRSLTPNYKYINSLRTLRSTSEPAPSSINSSKIVVIRGHLFDYGLINQVFDLIEYRGGNFSVQDVSVTPNTPKETRISRAVIEVSAASPEEVAAILKEVEAMTQAMPQAQADVRILPSVLRQRPGHESAKQAPPFPVSFAAKQCKVLVLGSGFVVPPLVHYLVGGDGVEVVLGSSDLKNAKVIANSSSKTMALHLDATDEDAMEREIRGSDIVVSLLPASMHPGVASLCVKNGKNLVTASYQSEGMKALDDAARDANVLLVNEVGLDPGLDHMSAMKVIDEVRESGGRVRSFESYCGGLPAPESADNPFGYKFSWSPIGVLAASQNDAIYRRNGQDVRVEGSRLLESAADMQLNAALTLEHLPNRNSLPYATEYGLADADTFYRGTIRYKGFSTLLKSCAELGLLNHNAKISDANNGWARVLPSDPDRFLKGRVGSKESKRCIDALTWLGMFGDEESPELVEGASLMEAFCARLQKKLYYQPHERDMVLMHHVFGIEDASGKELTKTSSLFCYGDPGTYSAMARTVGVTAGIVTRLILDGKLSHRCGLLKPTTRDIYEPVLEEISRHGVRFTEK